VCRRQVIATLPAGRAPEEGAERNGLPGRLVPSLYVSAAFWGIPFTHYILDSVIWRVRGNQELASALRLG